MVLPRVSGAGILCISSGIFFIFSITTIFGCIKCYLTVCAFSGREGGVGLAVRIVSLSFLFSPEN